jgi:uracil-DNA glycosylase family 4
LQGRAAPTSNLAAGEAFDPRCSRCPRLVGHRTELSRIHPDYHNAPVAAFGDPKPRLLIVGLAPGRHGANATGRPFTGDYAGILLYRTLHELGLASAPESIAADDDLTLTGARITNAIKCLPPENKPTTAEANRCLPFLRRDIDELPAGAALLALGAVAHRSVLKCAQVRLAAYPFAHGAVHELPDGRHLIDSYHCSRYNTQTRRLTTEMFRDVLAKALGIALA